MNLQVIKGTLLGDAWIQKYKNRPSSYGFNFEQSEFEYALWKAKMIGLPFRLTKRKRFDKRTNKTYYSYNVGISMDKKIKKELYDSFYTPVKEINNKILDSLTDLSIAVWYMDDGSMFYNGDNCHLSLSTDGFNKESVDLILLFFKNKYDISFKRTGRNYGSIRITSKKECIKFMKIVEKFIPKCMKRKKLNQAINKHRKNKYGK